MSPLEQIKKWLASTNFILLIILTFGNKANGLLRSSIRELKDSPNQISNFTGDNAGQSQNEPNLPGFLLIVGDTRDSNPSWHQSPGRPKKKHYKPAEYDWWKNDSDTSMSYPDNMKGLTSKKHGHKQQKLTLPHRIDPYQNTGTGPAMPSTLTAAVRNDATNTTIKAEGRDGIFKVDRKDDKAMKNGNKGESQQTKVETQPEAIQSGNEANENPTKLKGKRTKFDVYASPADKGIKDSKTMNDVNDMKRDKGKNEQKKDSKEGAMSSKDSNGKDPDKKDEMTKKKTKTTKKLKKQNKRMDGNEKPKVDKGMKDGKEKKDGKVLKNGNGKGMKDGKGTKD